MDKYTKTKKPDIAPTVVTPDPQARKKDPPKDMAAKKSLPPWLQKKGEPDADDKKDAKSKDKMKSDVDDNTMDDGGPNEAPPEGNTPAKFVQGGPTVAPPEGKFPAKVHPEGPTEYQETVSVSPTPSSRAERIEAQLQDARDIAHLR